MRYKTMQVKRTTYSMTDEVINKLEQLSKDTGLKKSAVLSVLINNAETVKAIKILKENSNNG